MSVAFKKEVYSWEHLIKEVCEVISDLTGNVMAEKQRPMVESRMRRRCLELKLDSAEKYRNYWMTHRESENSYLTGLLTTHFTSFFREFPHFEWIASELPNLVAAARAEGRSTLKFWSAASSKGQEVWSLCMWLHHHLPKIDPKMNWLIVGSDIDPLSVKEAENGVYHRRELETAPRHLWEGLWIRGKDNISDWYKIKPELKSKAHFQTMNLLNITMPLTEKFDVIMCRNVLIYFNRENQEGIAKNLMKHLTPQGALITGMSESLSGYGLNIKGMAPSVYKSPDAQIISIPATSRNASIHTGPVLPKPLKVLCIDDSPTVLNILKKVLRAPDFEIIGTANNGEEAIQKMKTLKPDVLTLDLHMPVMDGPTFLKQTGVGKNLPVIVVSSVGRDDASMVTPLFDMGVCDFVEKPTLVNINQISEELGQKLKMGWMSKKKGYSSQEHKLTVRSKQRPSGRIVFNFGPSDEANVFLALRQQKWNGDELIFVHNGSTDSLVAFQSKVNLYTGQSTKQEYISSKDKMSSSYAPTIWLHFKQGDLGMLDGRKRQDFLVIEENPSLPASQKEMADDISPVTSFSYLVNKLLGGD